MIWFRSTLKRRNCFVLKTVKSFSTNWLAAAKQANEPPPSAPLTQIITLQSIAKTVKYVPCTPLSFSIPHAGHETVVIDIRVSADDTSFTPSFYTHSIA